MLNTMKTYTFQIPLEPMAQPRPRFARMGAFVKVYEPTATTRYKTAIGIIARANKLTPLEGRVRVRLDFVLSRPKHLQRQSDPYHLIPCGVRPDLDNLAKCCLDALNKVAWRDDGQIVELVLKKWYAEKDGRPRTEVHVTEVVFEATPVHPTLDLAEVG